VNKMLSFSLFGNNPLYLKGLEKNLILAQRHYPSWNIRVHVDSLNFNSVKTQFEQNQVEVVESEIEYVNQGLFERFRPMFDPMVDLWISRDLDSRITSREVSAVNDWIQTGMKFHVMRDSHNHSYPVMAGMFGMRAISRHTQRIFQNKIRKYFGTDMTGDQKFLAEVVWKKYKKNCVIHDHWHNRRVENVPIDIESEDGVAIADAYGVGLEKFLNSIRDVRHSEIFPKLAIIRSFPKDAEENEPLYVGQIVLPEDNPALSQAMRWEYELRGRKIPEKFEPKK